MAIINYIPNVKTATGFDTLNTVSQFTNHVATGVFTNGDTYEINVPAPNDILTGQFVLIFVSDSDSIVGMKVSINNGTAIPIDGVGVGSLQNGVATSLLVDVDAGFAYPYFKDVDLTANNLPLTTETANLYGLSGVDANVDKALEEIHPRLNDLEFKSFVTETVDKTMIIPDNVNKVYIWACAAGINSSAYQAGKAGDFIIGKEFNVTPGGAINITVGSGNTIISGAGINKTLIAGNSTVSAGYTGFGIITGVAGGAAQTASIIAPGGAFGYGGGEGSSGSTLIAGVGGGISNVLPGGTPVLNAAGGDGVKGISLANLSKLLPNLFTSAGAGGSGAANSGSPNKAGGNSGGGNLGGQKILNGAGGNGGGAGGYGAAGGSSPLQVGAGNAGQPSPGMVLIGY